MNLTYAGLALAAVGLALEGFGARRRADVCRLRAACNMGLLRIIWEKESALRCVNPEPGLATGIILGTKEKMRWFMARPRPLEKADMVSNVEVAPG